MASSLQGQSSQLQSHLAAASNSLRVIENMQHGSTTKWSADSRPPLPKSTFQRSLADSRSCTYPSAYLHQGMSNAVGLSQDSQEQQQQLLMQQQCSPMPPQRFLAQTQSAPPTATLKLLTGMGLSNASGGRHDHRPQAIGGLSSDHALVNNHLADFGGLSKSALQFSTNQFGQHAFVGSHDWPRAGFKQDGQLSAFAPQLQPTFSAASSQGHSTQTAFGQSLVMPRAHARSQPLVQNAFTSQQGLQSGLHSRPQSPFGLSPKPSEQMLQPQTAFNLPLQSSLQAGLGQPPRGLLAQLQRNPGPQQSPFGQPQGSIAFSMPFRSTPYGSNTATLSTSTNPTESLPGEAVSMDVCQSPGLSAGLQPRSSAHLSNLASQRLAWPLHPESGLSRWQNQPSCISALSPFDATQPATSLETHKGPSQETLHPNGLTSDCRDDSVLHQAQWFSHPDDMRKAALELNAQLAQIDKQVLEHIVPRCGHPGSQSPHQTNEYIIAHQVQSLSTHA